MSRIHVHIDRLVLKGIDPDDAEAVSAGIERAIAQSLKESPADNALINAGDATRLKAGKIATATTPAETGQRIGQRIAGSEP